MAPLSVRLVRAIDKGNFHARGLGDNLSQDLTVSQKTALQYLALSFSIVSVVSAILAFYWFLKMRRSFRHDMIMLLIQSDMFKALWFMMYPIVTFAKGPVPNSSKFCQVNGFFLSVGIEASDVAVLMIAIHSALYIFRPKVSTGEGGLYPYRRIALTVWFLYPITMASLAFVNGSDAYTNDGTYCYLPVRPFWYQLALTWIPRYVIFSVILGIYASIYFFVRYKFHGFTRSGRSRSDVSSESSRVQEEIMPKLRDVPMTPPLACHGLISEPEENAVRGRKQSVSTMETIQNSPINPASGTSRFIWANLLSSNSIQTPPARSTPEILLETDSFSGPATPQPLPRYLPAAAFPSTPNSNLVSVSPSQSRLTSWGDPFVQRLTLSPDATPRSRVDIFTALSHRPGHTVPPTPVAELRLTNSRGQDLAVAEMLRTRDKIRRQLRFLFIYPLVYIGMWILPFVSHVLQYDNKYAVKPPFGLTCITTICICSQAAVDCWLFSTREKPWRHIPGNDDKSFFGSLRFWTGWKDIRKRRVTHGPGKTRNEMAREARAAYRRRDEEMEHRRSIASQKDIESAMRGQRSWWEVAGLDGGMSPVPEEHANPMDDIISVGSPMPDGGTIFESTKPPGQLNAQDRKRPETPISEKVKNPDRPDA